MLPREISVERWPEQTTFTFPMRPLGRLRLIGLVPIGFAAAFVTVAMTMLWPLLRQLGHSTPGPGRWIPLVFIGMIVLFALTPVSLGLFVLAGHCRLAVSRDRVTATEIAGPIFWRRKARVKHILRIEVGGPGRAGGGPQPRALLGLGLLTAVLKNGNRTVLAVGYPAEWMTAIAEEISGLLKLQGVPVAVRDVTGAHPEAITDREEPLAQPAGSRVTVTESGGGILLAIPSRGFWKESYSLPLFGCLWCAFVGVFTATAFFQPRQRGWSLPGLIGFLALFWSVGISMLVFAVHLGTRKWSLEAGQTGLSAKVQSRLRSRAWQWPQGQVMDVQVGDSSVEVNHRRLRELKIILVGAKPKGLLAGRDEDELAWIASLLRRHLRVK